MHKLLDLKTFVVVISYVVLPDPDIIRNNKHIL